MWRIYLLFLTLSILFVNGNSQDLVADKAVTCTSRSMDVQLLFTRAFSGGVFTEKGFQNENCRWTGKGSSEIIVKIPINDTECGVEVKEESGEYTVKLIISPVEGLIVDGFSALNVRCVYSTQDITLTLPAGEDGKSGLKINSPSADASAVVTGSGGAPLLSMQILDGHGIAGPVVAKAAVGQRITLDLVLKDTSIYDFYVHSCFAHDGTNTPDASIQVIDINGCGIRLSRAIDVPVLKSDPVEGGAKHVYLYMYGFQFTSSQFVHFECQVRPCVHSCKREQCEAPATKVPLIPASRRRRDENATNVSEMNSLRLQTILQIEPQHFRKAALVSSSPMNDCISVSSIIFVSLLLFGATIMTVVVFYCVCSTNRRKDQSTDNMSEAAYSVTDVYSTVN